VRLVVPVPAEPAHEATARRRLVFDCLLGALLSAAAEPAAKEGGEDEEDAADDNGGNDTLCKTATAAAVSALGTGYDGSVVDGDVHVD
jgi:hypothetical protein